MNILEVANLRKSFAAKKVLKGVNLEVPENCIFGLVGRNGAGKTTLMKSILGLLPYETGLVKICQEEVACCETPKNGLVGYLPDVPEFYNFMTASEYLTLCGNITAVPKDLLKKRIAELLEMVGLAGEKIRIKGYSRGMKQRLGIAQALINKPRLLICDEPTSALDPVGHKEILDILKDVKAESSVIFSTHILSDVERISDRIAFLEGGIIKLTGTIEELKSLRQTANLEIVLANKDDSAIFAGLDLSSEILEEGVVLFKDVSTKETNEILAFLVNNGLSILKYELKKPSLEDLFLEVIANNN